MNGPASQASTPVQVVDPPEVAPFVASALALLREAAALGPAAFASSLGREDQAITALIARERLPIQVFTLDTGRLPPETLALIPETERRYRLRIRVMFPEAAQVEQYVAINGLDGFYESVSQRKHCCEVRKIGPLKRALEGKAIWVAGLRRAHGEMRADLAPISPDALTGLPKCAPLHDWSDAVLDAFLAAHDVPVNPMHARGYPSIGCAPCTRAVAPGEPVRSGRWWWEQGAGRECGLHAAPTASAVEPIASAVAPAAASDAASAIDSAAAPVASATTSSGAPR